MSVIAQGRIKESFDQNWKFVRLNDEVQEGDRIGKMGKKWQDQFNVTHIETSGSKDVDQEKSMDSLYQVEKAALEGKKWEPVSLPHTAFVEPLVIKHQWQGVCYYKKDFSIDGKFRGRKIFLMFEGCMQEANVWVNGLHKIYHAGGYTPFTIDVTKEVLFGALNTIVVRLDNRDNPLIPPGKPVGQLDFNYYSGIYRNTYLVVTGSIHITDPVYENIPAGGGVFVTYPLVSKKKAIIHVKTHVRNEDPKPGKISLLFLLLDKDNKRVGQVKSGGVEIPGNLALSIEGNIEINKPDLWSPDAPNLYTLKVIVLKNDTRVDEQKQRIGIRWIEFTRQGGCKINGRSVRLEGSNRHMEYPYIGNALSDNANYRDIYKLKKAGFNIVRLSHYPQAPSVYSACDELGILAIDCTPGWQFYNKDSIFIRNTFKDIRDMIRRDRNHPCIAFWEVLLNESWPPAAWKDKAYAIAHQEYPGNQCYTAGDMYGYYQWDILYNDWKDEDHSRPNGSSKPGFIREYGDYEFGGGSSTSRVLTGQGAQALLQQAWNLQWSQNILRRQYPWTSGQATWQFFDTNHGCCDNLSACGMMNIFRIPKFSWHYFHSQAGMDRNIFIADYWLPMDSLVLPDTLHKGDAFRKVVVYSNCEEVSLYLNGQLISRQVPDHGPDTPYGSYEEGGHPFDGGNCLHLAHPPFTFTKIRWKAGQLKAVGFIHGKPVCGHSVYTPGLPKRLHLEADLSGKPLKADGGDVIFVYASIQDARGVLAVKERLRVRFEVTGPGKIIGPAMVDAEAGIATILLQAGKKQGDITIRASATGLIGDRMAIRTKD